MFLRVGTFGGSLCLYPHGISSANIITIPSVFNRLGLRTDNKSLHGVLPVTILLSLDTP